MLSSDDIVPISTTVTQYMKAFCFPIRLDGWWLFMWLSVAIKRPVSYSILNINMWLLSSWSQDGCGCSISRHHSFISWEKKYIYGLSEIFYQNVLVFFCLFLFLKGHQETDICSKDFHFPDTGVLGSDSITSDWEVQDNPWSFGGLFVIF
jgi:hypothetical protein